MIASDTFVMFWQELPIRSKLDPALYGPQESALTEEVIAREVEHYGTTIEKVS